MFCTTLRRRSSFAASIPSLTSGAGLALRENQLETHDIELPLSISPQRSQASRHEQPPPRRLRLLLLSPACVSTTRLPATLSRIDRFATLTGGIDIAIIMLLSASPAIATAMNLIHPLPDSGDNDDDTSGVYAYATLQAELFALRDLPAIPILVLSSISSLAGLIRSHADAITRPVQRPSDEVSVSCTEVLNHCTTEGPLSPFAVDLITDIFPSLRELAAEATALRAFEGAAERCMSSADYDDGDEIGSLRGELQPGLEVLREQLGGGVVRGLVDFWQDEWTLE